MLTRHRDWTKATVGKTRTIKGTATRRGTDASLTFSIPTAMAQEYLKKHGDGLPTIHMKIHKKPEGFLLLRSGPEEWGRKFSPGSLAGLDYRIFFSDSSYDWVPKLEPFGSTPVEAKLQDGGIWVPLPPPDKRNPLMPYVPKRIHRKTWTHQQPVYHGQQPAIHPASPGEAGVLYLVMVPPEKDEKFHTLLKFLKLEALKE